MNAMKSTHNLKSARRPKFKIDKEYLTESELRYFENLLETGAISYFRTTNCVVCRKTIPKYGFFKYCSKNCKENEKEKNDENQCDDETG